jgi:hypothetical protein
MMVVAEQSATALPVAASACGRADGGSAVRRAQMLTA